MLSNQHNTNGRLRFKADITLFLVAILWGTAFTAQRMVAQSGNVYLFNGARFLLAAVLLIPFIRNRRISKDQFLWMSVAGLLIFVASALQQAGMIFTTAGNAGFITSLYVILVPVILFLGWNERTHWLLWLAVVQAAIGAYLLSTGGKLETSYGDWLVLAGAVLWAAHVVLIGKAASRFDFLTFAIGQYFIAGCFNSLFGIWFEDPSILTSLQVQLAILYTAILAIAIGFTLQVWAQRHTPPTDAALILCLEAVFAVLAGWMILGESLTPLQIAGCILILLAVLLAQARTIGSGRINESD